MKKSIISLAILIAGLTACSHNEDGVSVKEPVQVSNVSLTLSTSLLTRAAGDTEIGTGKSVQFNEGLLYFVSNVNHSIVHRVTVQGSPTTAVKDESGRTELIGLSGEEETKETIYNIPVEEGYRVFMIGNPTDVIKNIKGGNFSEVEKAVISAITENKNASGEIDGGVDNVTLYGYGTVVEGETEIEEGEEENTEITTYRASLTVGSAVTARIEIPYLEAKGNIASFNLDGIYIGRTYVEVALNGQAVESSRIGDSSDFDVFELDYAALSNGILHDKLDVSSNSEKRAVAGSGKVWSYNVLTYNPTYAGGSDLDAVSGYVDNMPSIVFVLSNVEAVEDSGVYFDNDQPHYITVQGFLDSGEKEVDALKPGYIYNLSAGVEVDEKTVTDKPNVNRIDVEVEVSLMGWESENVSPII